MDSIRSQHIICLGGFVALAVIFSALSACGVDTGDSKTTDGGSQGVDGATTGDTGATNARDAPSRDTAAADTASVKPRVDEPAKPGKYSAGTACPTFKKGENAIWSWGKTRYVDVYLPDSLDNPGLLFLWHGLGDNKENFGPFMNAQALAKGMSAIVLVPQGNVKVTGWGWSSNDESTLDAALFDDLLTCIDAQYDIDNRKVWSMGFSAGGLWSSWLAMHRSAYLASVVVWSGGAIKEAKAYNKPKRKIPVLLAWGGAKDVVAVKFEEATLNMATRLRADGHFVVTCNHGLGHRIPPKGLNWAVDFLSRHTFGINRSSLATSKKLQDLYPSYCSYQ